MRKLLFLCTGNYYRSRFAEILFNTRAVGVGLAWRADSRALDLPGNRIYIRGPISPFALEGLVARCIPLGEDIRDPIQVEEADLAVSDLIIAMKEAEHRPVVERLFPAHAGRVEYWHMHDIDCAEPPECLGQIERAIGELIERLKVC